MKRVNVPDKASLNTLRKEVDAMRKLQGIDCIVSYIDSHAARQHNGAGPGYEVFVLMEYCSRKGLIDFMNTRLVNKLTEPEILVIMQNITEAIAHMHALNPPLIHRDIKIENVLLGDDGTYKLCDFGSVSSIINPPANVEEFQLIQDDIMKNTTPQYRAPEMLDLYRRQPINEKSDVWALGVFLYKLCYYTTPFEQNAINGNMNGYGGDYAIINGIYSFPPSPHYSARLKNIIAKLLTVDPKLRPNVFQLLDEVCKLRGVSTPNITPKSNPSLSGIPYAPISMKTGGTIGSSSSSIYNYNNTNNNNMQPSISSNSVTGITNSISGKSAVDTPPPSTFKYNALKDSINSSTKSNTTNTAAVNHSTAKRIETPPIQVTPAKDLPKVRSTKSKRPLSLFGSSNLTPSFNRHGSRESLDIKNFMNELSNEEVVNFASPDKNENVSSSVGSVDYLKSLSRQNTNSKKRSSISSIKNLLTGGSSSKLSFHAPVLQPSRSNSTHRHTSSYSTKRNSSLDSLPDGHSNYKKVSSDLADLKEMSPEAKPTKKFQQYSPMKVNHTPLTSSISSSPTKNTRSAATSSNTIPHNSHNSHNSHHMSNSIQSRVKNLFRNASPPPVKTAHGYGKYTESGTPTTPKKSPITGTPKSLELSTPTTNMPQQKQKQIQQQKSGTLSTKKSPPPKPKKPEYLKSPSSVGTDSFMDEDLDVLEKRFEMKFPGVV